jgi:phospholipid/cholesterol/gamma-HCH transport system substrate-binding protein
MPNPDKYYLLEVVDDPRGMVDQQIVQSNPPATGQPQVQVQQITRDAFKFSAEFAKRFSFLAFRFGIIESTGGVGSDIYFFKDALSLKLDAFNFSVAHLTYPRLRATLRLQAFNHLFVSGGVDDIFNRQSRDPFTNDLVSGRDFFLGGGVYFTDDDLKAVLPILPRIP